MEFPAGSPAGESDNSDIHEAILNNDRRSTIPHSHSIGALLLSLVVLAIPMYSQAQPAPLPGQSPMPAGVLPKARVTISNKETGATRIVESNGEGIFSAPSLPAGAYEVRVEATGFQVFIRPVEVITGSATTVNASMQIGTARETVTVAAATANLNLETNSVQGVVSRQQIDNLPLNGRSFLNLAQLEPGVTVAPGNPAQFNAQFNVSVLVGHRRTQRSPSMAATSATRLRAAGPELLAGDCPGISTFEHQLRSRQESPRLGQSTSCLEEAATIFTAPAISIFAIKHCRIPESGPTSITDDPFFA
jgi:hypothetical protein